MIRQANPDDASSPSYWSDSVDGPGFGSACAPINSWSAEDIVDDAWSDGPGGATPFINSYPDSVNDPGFGGAWSRLDTGDGSSGIDGSGCLTSVHPSAGPDGGELDDGRAADDSSGFAKKWLSGSRWPKELKQQLVQPIAWAWRCMVRAGHW
jgi:hypothetical protein